MLSEALTLLGDGRWRILAGGTDVYPSQGARPIRDNVLDIGALGGLRSIVDEGDAWRIGARTTWADIVRADLPPAFDALRAAAREVGSVQIQTTATVAGNLCNASPAADGVPPLLALDARVELQASRGSRQLPLSRFVLGNRQTACAPDELVTAILVPKASGAGRSAFLKLGARRYLVISIVMASVRLVERDGVVAEAAIAVGACSAVAQRLALLESDLVGQPADATLARRVEARHLSSLTPIDDVRATAEYRLLAARETVSRALAAVLAGTSQGLAA